MRRILACTGFSLLSLLAAAACGGGDSASPSATSAGPTSSSTSGTGGGGGGTQQIKCDSEPSTLSLTGTWAAYGKLAVKLKGVDGGAITPCPTDQTGESTLLLMLTIAQDTGDPTKLTEVKATLCSLELPVVTALVGTCDPNSPALVSAQIIAPQKLLDALPNVATMPVMGSLAGTSDGSMFSLDRLNVVVGSSKGDPMLPTWNTMDAACNMAALGHTNACEMTCVSDCASLKDDDVDTYPGVTVDVCGYSMSDTQKGVKCSAEKPSTPGTAVQGRAFIDIQVDPQLTGTAKSSCELDGTVDTKVLYNVIGADVVLEGASITVTQAIKSLPTFTIDAAQSKFRMVRIDGKYGAPDFMVDPSMQIASCKTIISRVNEIE